MVEHPIEDELQQILQRDRSPQRSVNVVDHFEALGVAREPEVARLGGGRRGTEEVDRGAKSSVTAASPAAGAEAGAESACTVMTVPAILIVSLSFHCHGGRKAPIVEERAGVRAQVLEHQHPAPPKKSRVAARYLRRRQLEVGLDRTADDQDIPVDQATERLASRRYDVEANHSDQLSAQVQRRGPGIVG